MKEGEGEEGERGEGACRCRGGATILQPWCVFINKLQYQFIAVPKLFAYVLRTVANISVERP